MKKVLLITRVSGFIPQHEMNNVRILQEMGYEVHYAANYNTVVYGKDNSRLDGTGIIRHQVDFDRLPIPKRVSTAYKQIKKIIEDGEYDLIHCHMPTSAAIARSAAESVRKKTGRKVPVIYTAHGFHFFSGAPLQNWLYYPVEKHYSRYTDRLILINEEDYNRACKFPLRGRAERINGVGVDLKKYEKYKKHDWGISGDIKPKDVEVDIHTKYNIKRDNAILISVGELTKLKNHMVIIEAFKELKDLKISYLICGSGPKEMELKKRVEELNLTDRVHFAGYVTNVPELLMQSDCFVLPSRREGLPVAMMEAMAVGLPVIATKIRGITDLIEHTKGGYLVDDWEPENYAVKIRRMFTLKDGKSNVKRDIRREEMGEWNRDRMKQFSLEVVEKQMREIYDGVTHGGVE